MTDRTAPALPADLDALLRLHGHVTTAEVAALGFSRADLDAWCRRGALARAMHGVYARPLEHPTRWAAYRNLVEAVLHAHAGALVPAGPAAAVLLNLPLIGPPPLVVHVAGPRTGGHKPGRLVAPIGPHRGADLVVVDGRPLASPARASLDTARLVGTLAGLAAADAGLRTGRADVDDLVRVLTDLAGRSGVARARRAVRLASPLSESPGESWSVAVIDGLGLPAPERQAVHTDRRGVIGRSDFWWPAWRLVGEFDGRVKYGRTNPSGRPPEDVLWAEKLREDRLRRAGCRVARWTAADLADPARLQAILAPMLS